MTETQTCPTTAHPQAYYRRREKVRQDWAEEWGATLAYRRLARFVGVEEANRLFDAAGLNGPTYPGKSTTAEELADYFIDIAIDAMRETL